MENPSRILFRLLMAFSVVRCLACESFEAIAEAQGNAELRVSLTTPTDAAQVARLLVTAAGVDEGCVCLSGHAVTPLAPLQALLGDRAVSTYIETPASVALDVDAPPIRPPIA